MDDRGGGDDRGTADDRAESAEFAPIRVGGRARRGWTPALIAGWIVVLGVVVGAGTIGRALDGSSAVDSRPTDSASRPASLPAQLDAIRSSDPDPLAYAVARDGTGLTITGTILARPVVWVFISVQDGAGKVLTWRSLSVEDPKNDIRPDYAPAFEVRLPLAPSLAAGPVIIEVNAYNNIGRKVGSVRQALGDRAGHNPIRINTGMVR
ncbi:MAG: hypothetical protein HY263_05765 [Chloroflexi bacterium]|nr:hypothetical protein [Chloroflexota bacterium]